MHVKYETIFEQDCRIFFHEQIGNEAQITGNFDLDIAVHSLKHWWSYRPRSTYNAGVPRSHGVEDCVRKCS